MTYLVIQAAGVDSGTGAGGASTGGTTTGAGSAFAITTEVYTSINRTFFRSSVRSDQPLFTSREANVSR